MLRENRSRAAQDWIKPKPLAANHAGGFYFALAQSDVMRYNKGENQRSEEAYSMKLKLWEENYSICRVEQLNTALLAEEHIFVTKAESGMTVVIRTEAVPAERVWQEDGWRMFSLSGQLVYTLMGILGKIATILGNNSIGVYAVSSADNIYFLVREKNLAQAQTVLEEKGYFFI